MYNMPKAFLLEVYPTFFTRVCWSRSEHSDLFRCALWFLPRALVEFEMELVDTQVIPGRVGKAAEALCWVGERLFSAGLNGEITEYDLEKLRPRYTVEAYGGPIWTISCNHQETLLSVSNVSVIPQVSVQHLVQICMCSSHLWICWTVKCIWLNDCCLFQVGCEDGTVKLFEILDEKIQFQRNLSRQKSKMLIEIFLFLFLSHLLAFTFFCETAALNQ